VHLKQLVIFNFVVSRKLCFYFDRLLQLDSVASFAFWLVDQTVY